MGRIARVVNVIPLIAQADSMLPSEIDKLREKVSAFFSI
jgi:septin family protein